EVWQSARAPSVSAYRTRLGIDGPPRVAVIIQQLVCAHVAGVLFTRDPLTGADQRVIEAAWGLGEAVVAGIVVPDRYRIDRAGRALAGVAGEKDLMLVPRTDGGVDQCPVDAARVHARVLDDRQLAALNELAHRVEQAFGSGGHDLEWAIEGDALHL